MTQFATDRNAISLNDSLVSSVSRAAEKFRAHEQIGDLVRLRDERVFAGKHVKNALETGWQSPRNPPPDLFGIGPSGIPEIPVHDLTSEAVQSAMHHYGALIVRNFFEPARALAFQKDIDRVLASAKAYAKALVEERPDDRSTTEKSFFMPLKKTTGMNKKKIHSFLENSGSVETLLSPKVSSDLLDAFEQIGLRSILQDYFQDEPCVSYQKCVLRRAMPLDHKAEWHQDGAFMDKDIQSLNVWVALTDCGEGTESPGMDLIPKRLTEVIPTGTDGAAFTWSVSAATVATAFPETPPARPYFGAGDAVFFDHFNLHATSSDPSFTQPRYAIETWFFSKSRCAKNQKPVFW